MCIRDRYLHDRRCSSIPLLHWFGNYQNKFAIVLTKYDCSLYEYALNHSMSDNTINDIMLKMLSIIEDIHKLFIFKHKFYIVTSKNKTLEKDNL